MKEKNDILGLGLESSCDETSASVVLNGKKILSNIIKSQIDIHREYSGVVPEIASRAHLEVINEIISSALKEAGINFVDLVYVSATARPGLIGSLLIALQSAKAISYALHIPLIAVNHLEAHLYAPFLENNALVYPYIGLLVSGGNTNLYLVKVNLHDSDKTELQFDEYRQYRRLLEKYIDNILFLVEEIQRDSTKLRESEHFGESGFQHTGRGIQLRENDSNWTMSFISDAIRDLHRLSVCRINQ